MSRVVKMITCALIGALLAVSVAGCGDQTAEANAAIEAANKQAQTYMTLDKEITVLMDKAGSVDFTPEGVKPGIEAIDEALAKLAERKTVVANMKAEYAKIESMDVREEIKTYAKQQLEIADIFGEMDELGTKMLTDTKTLYQMVEADSSDSAKAQELAEAIEETSAMIKELGNELREKQAESDKYFEDNNLGGK
ncbi:MAG: hypothetical protein LLG24_08210 [Actinomycetia bacterium]|nr:hypothetical protein [Actinomycetes bacterium]